jgi:hypothetical protein
LQVSTVFSPFSILLLNDSGRKREEIFKKKRKVSFIVTKENKQCRSEEQKVTKEETKKT